MCYGFDSTAARLVQPHEHRSDVQMEDISESMGMLTHFFVLTVLSSPIKTGRHCWQESA